MAATRYSRLEPGARALLLQTATDAIESQLDRRAGAVPVEALLPPELREPGASFVTLTLDGQLRGCCGTLEARRPLATDVWHNAGASAFGDPRFAPLEAWEWRRVELEVSVLSPLERVAVRSERELLEQLVPGEHGLVIAWRGSRATFLPKVWEQLREPVDFLRHLKHKAGWSVDFWAEDVEVWRYFTDVFAAGRSPGSD